MVVSAKTSDPLALDLWPPSGTSAARSFSFAVDHDAEVGVGVAVPELTNREAVEEYVRGLEEERSKVEWFQRELPLCMLILTHVIEGLKGELARRGGGDAMAIEKKAEAEGEEVKRRKDRPEEASRMTSSWLWSPNCGANASIRDDGGKMAGTVGTDEPPPLQAPRKARRSWSPELHRRFVSAVEHLGGSQAATPKQIRQLMKVDGLTNDEVKSHLQKYRLHRQRSPAVSSSPADRQHLVLWGGVLQVTKENPWPVGKQGISHDSGSPSARQHH